MKNYFYEVFNWVKELLTKGLIREKWYIFKSRDGNFYYAMKNADEYKDEIAVIKVIYHKDNSGKVYGMDLNKLVIEAYKDGKKEVYI